ncbi:hypothetical protein DSM21852_15660 [Methylocystis bryophila]|uniref:Uncharacterized protein n=1 Tax=Methylocystis bryophila TaxID=655015 RepID=A0A1W6MX63_9HYPH|nr:hypothetical protein B1812_15025 [Methylocystis bryophila]BDV38313.1 hypothetical protein DSM21852_15660 [Methylocystis bryophila]
MTVNKKIVCLPTEEELSNRLLRHLQWRQGSIEVVLLWKGYLAALLEWSLIEVQTYDRLIAHLPKIALTESQELFLGGPFTPESEKETDEHLLQDDAQT